MVSISVERDGSIFKFTIERLTVELIGYIRESLSNICYGEIHANEIRFTFYK